MSIKKPDNIVFNKESKTYDASLKAYGTNVGAPSISTVDTVLWKNRNLQSVNAEFKAKYNELKSALDEFKSDFEFNEMVYSSKFSFEPIVGETYHLYRNNLDQDFLSILAPNECNFDFVGSFNLNSNKIWVKVG